MTQAAHRSKRKHRSAIYLFLHRVCSVAPFALADEILGRG